MLSVRALTCLLVVSCFVLTLPAGVAQTAVLHPTNLSFGNQAINTTSSPRKVSLTNTGTAPLNITSITTNGDFTQTNDCPSALAAKATCNISVTFAPVAIGVRTGTLTIRDNAGTGTQSVSLKGTGIAQVVLSPTSLSFGSVVVGVPSTPKAVKLTNDLNVPLSITSMVPSISDFSVQSGCGPQVAPKGTCTLTVTFTPAAVGPRSGQLTITDSANPSTQTVGLSGKGLAIKLLSITVLPAATNVLLGTTQQFQAVGNYNDGTTKDLTGTATWSSSVPSVATISNNAGSKGLATALQPGTTTISAKQGITGSTTATVVPVLVSISVTPANPEVPAGTAQQFTATGNYNDGSQKDLTSTATWTSSNPVVASVSTAGLAATATPGQTTISAALGSISGSAQLQVDPAALASISVTPALVFVGVGSNRQYTATGTFTDGTAKNMTSSVIWTTSDHAIATVDALGLGTSTGAGAASVTAMAGTISGSGTMNGIRGGFVDCDARVLDMNVLVVTNGRGEPDFPAITQALDYLGTPYTVFDMSTPGSTIAPEFLSSGCHGFFQGVIFTIAGYRYLLDGISNLDSYENQFQVRHLNWFAFPGTDFGLNAPTDTIPAVPPTPYPANYAPAAATVFPYANAANPLTINFSTIYLSTPFNGATPLLTDANGNALAVLYNPPWGSYQQLTLTFDSNPYLTHNLVLSYGLVNWVTQGVFLGARHAYFTPQVDDYFIDDAEWLPATPCGTNTDHTGATYRINAADLSALIDWQNAKQGQPLTANFVLHMAFNGFGALAGSYTPDDLTPATQTNQALFKWINHTFDHTNLNHVDQATATSEITQNNDMAATLGLTYYDPRNMVTPDISGLTNGDFLQAAVDNGVRYLVTDTSRPGYDNPTPNTGIVNPLQPSILMIPRHPNNLFFNVSTPDEWAAEYACIYPELSYSYPQILDNISDSFVANLLKGDIDPEMFHQPNLRAYDGTHSLLGDLADATFTKYNNLVTLPVLSLTEDAIGATMASRAQYNSAGVTASFILHQRIMITAQQAATVPVTGLPGAQAENYGGQSISYIDVAAGQTVIMPLP